MMKRREFLKRSATAAATTLTATAMVATPVLIRRTALAQGARPGANDRIGIGAVGVGRQGSSILAQALRDPRTEPIGLCDVWDQRAADIAKKQGMNFTCRDYRELLDRRDIDAILTATPEQWRSLICVSAALAGKHLYVEKPITLTIEDGTLIRRAVAKTGVIFQSGSMQRSYIKNHLACLFVREGHLGAIHEVRVANYESPWLADFAPVPIPDGLDWNLWCGPAPLIPFHPDIFAPRGNPGWISIRDFSGGEVTGWGTHGLDQVQCALGLDDTVPVEILVEGDALLPPTYTQPESRDRGDRLCATPKLSYRYANGITVRLVSDKIGRGGGVFVGERGTLTIDRDKMVSDPPELAEGWLRDHAETTIPDHMTNWIDSIYSGATPVGHLEGAIRTATVCHLLNIARFLGRSLRWDPATEQCVGDAEANRFLAREHRKGFEQPHG